jgi:thymidylate kinase
LKFARFISGAENKGESFNSARAIEKLKEVVACTERGNVLSVSDLVFISFLERRAHMRSILRSGAFAGNYVILKGYELSVFAFGMAAGVSFSELLELRNLALGELWAYPSITILFDVPARISKFYLGQRGMDLPLDYLERLSLSYEAAIARLQGSGNYGFVIRVRGDKGEGVVFADILGKLSRYMPIFS